MRGDPGALTLQSEAPPRVTSRVNPAAPRILFPLVALFEIRPESVISHVGVLEHQENAGSFESSQSKPPRYSPKRSDIVDELSPEHRSENMRRIRGTDTTPELLIRRDDPRFGFRIGFTFANFWRHPILSSRASRASSKFVVASGTSTAGAPIPMFRRPVAITGFRNWRETHSGPQKCGNVKKIRMAIIGYMGM
jgi:hypothetical protein